MKSEYILGLILDEIPGWSLEREVEKHEDKRLVIGGVRLARSERSEITK